MGEPNRLEKKVEAKDVNDRLDSNTYEDSTVETVKILIGAKAYELASNVLGVEDAKREAAEEATRRLEAKKAVVITKAVDLALSRTRRNGLLEGNSFGGELTSLSETVNFLFGKGTVPTVPVTKAGNPNTFGIDYSVTVVYEVLKLAPEAFTSEATKLLARFK